MFFMKKFLFTLLILTIGVPVLKVFVTVGNHDLLLSREMTADYYMKEPEKFSGIITLLVQTIYLKKEILFLLR